MAAASSASAGRPHYRTCGLAGCTRRVHADPRSGIVHDFCGRTHAQAALGSRLGPPHGICHVCAYPGCNEPVFFEADTGRVHEYCSKTHAMHALNRGLRPDSNRRLQGTAAPGDRCSLPGCSAPRFREPDGFLHDYCGRSHARLALNRGILPAQPGDTTVDRVWRGRQGEPPYTVSVLTNSHPKYAGIKEQFYKAWEHPGTKPTVVRILQVRNPTAVFDRFTHYKAGLPEHNERRRFHGTALAPDCSFGIDLSQPPCDNPSCAVCTICATSFDVSKANSATGFLRYGSGLYFSRVSSKANDYAHLSERRRVDGTFRMVFLCKVTLGDSHRTREERLSEHDVWHVVNNLDCHSVTGLTIAEGGRLNYPEDVVYVDEAAIPSYLVVYKL